jgi:hypothetical protein
MECIKHIAVHSYGNTSRESRVFVEDMPMGVVVHRHKWNYGKDTEQLHIPQPLRPSSHWIYWNYKKGMREREPLMETEGQTTLEPRLLERKAK